MLVRRDLNVQTCKLWAQPRKERIIVAEELLVFLVFLVFPFLVPPAMPAAATPVAAANTLAAHAVSALTHLRRLELVCLEGLAHEDGVEPEPHRFKRSLARERIPRQVLGAILGAVRLPERVLRVKKARGRTATAAAAENVVKPAPEALLATINTAAAATARKGARHPQDVFTGFAELLERLPPGPPPQAI